jgi:trehalose 6-phosphate phosphatase
MGLLATMQRPALAPPNDHFFLALRHADWSLLILDYDGTLAPFRVDRDEAVPYEGVRDALAAVGRNPHTRVVLVTGRSLSEITRLLDIKPAPEIWASHGWERRGPDGGATAFPLPEGARSALDLALQCAGELGLQSACEVKPASLALHWRGLTRDETASVERRGRDLWEPIADASNLELHTFDGGLELRVPGRDKGSAVRSIVANAGPDVVVAFLGDDLTDEDAFRALPETGLSVLVRGEARSTDAKSWLRPPEELLAFLHRWAATAGGDA